MIGVSEDQPIGVFDSGVGGLTVVRVLLEKLPQEKVIYLGDNAHLPYGSRTVEELKGFATQIADFLWDRSQDDLSACNTSRQFSLEYLTENYALPIVGVIEPESGGLWQSPEMADWGFGNRSHDQKRGFGQTPVRLTRLQRSSVKPALGWCRWLKAAN